MDSTRGMKSYEIAKELKVDPATVSRDIQYLVSQSQKFLDDLAKETLPFMYQTSIEGIRNVMKECWSIYYSDDKSINWFQKLAALKLIKESNEALFKLVGEGPSIDAVPCKHSMATIFLLNASYFSILLRKSLKLGDRTLLHAGT